MNGITSTGLAGMTRGFAQAEDSCFRLSTSFIANSNQDPVATIVDLSSAVRQIDASAVAVKTGQEIQKHLLDLFA